MLKNLRKFFSLNAQQKYLFIEAYITLSIYKLALATRQFKSLVDECEQMEAAIEEKQLDESGCVKSREIGVVINTAANHTPWESACLVQALTAQRMLRKRKIPGKFHLGAKVNCLEDDPLAAHAWAICGDEILTGKAGHGGYTILSTFSWHIEVGNK